LSNSKPNKFKDIGHLVAIASAKGGVGKSTITANLALALQNSGASVGVLDADILGPSIPGMLGIDTGGRPQQDGDGRIIPAQGYGIKLVSMGMFGADDKPMMLRGPMLGKYLNLFLSGVAWGKLDYLLLDLPPGTGDTQLTLGQNFPLSGAIVVTTPQAVSAGITLRGARMFQQMKIPILGVVENMRTFTCQQCGSTTDLFGHGGGERLAERLETRFLGALPLDAAVMEGGDNGQPVVVAAPDSSSANAFAAIAERLIEQLDEQRIASEPFLWRWEKDDQAAFWRDNACRADGSAVVLSGLRRHDARTLSVLWEDGKQQLFDLRALRLACPCARCIDEMTGRPLVDPAMIPADIAPRELRSVGTYAIAISWSDGHSSGIYAFESLRALGVGQSVTGDR
jgi:ATP-binding protein involved in chromosome partitioning